MREAFKAQLPLHQHINHRSMTMFIQQQQLGPAPPIAQHRLISGKT